MSGTSVFTDALTRGIVTGAADANQDGRISLNELFEYISEQVRDRNPHQTPSKWEIGLRGEIIIARNSRRQVLPGALPEELLALLRHSAPAGRIGAVTELKRLAAGSDLPVAASAREALRSLTDDDSLRVREIATEGLGDSALRVSQSPVALARARQGASPPKVSLVVGGGPLASASAVTVTGDGLRAWLEDGELHLSCSTARVGKATGTVHLRGYAGDADIPVTAEITANAGSSARSAREPIRRGSTGNTRTRATLAVTAALGLAATAVGVWHPWTGDGEPNTPTLGAAGPVNSTSATPDSLPPAADNCSPRNRLPLTAADHDPASAPAIYLSVCIKQDGERRQGELKSESTASGLRDTSVDWQITLNSCTDQKNARQNPPGNSGKTFITQDLNFAADQGNTLTTALFTLSGPWRTQGIANSLATTDAAGTVWRLSDKAVVSWRPQDCG